MLDRTDRRILSLLQGDGRIAGVELAEKVGLSPTANVFSPPGDYPIVPSGSVVAANYFIQSSNGTLTITTAQQFSGFQFVMT